MRGNPDKTKPFRWKPGQSGNPKGRPFKKPITERYEALLEDPLPEQVRVSMRLAPGATWGDALALGQIRSAAKGNTLAAREIAERLEGKVAHQVQVSGKEGQPIRVSLEATLERIEAFYGIRRGPAASSTTDQPVSSVPVPDPVDSGPKPPEDSRKK